MGFTSLTVYEVYAFYKRRECGHQVQPYSKICRIVLMQCLQGGITADITKCPAHGANLLHILITRYI